MDQIALKNLKKIVSAHAQNLDEIINHLPSVIEDRFQKEFCTKYYLDEDVYHNLYALALNLESPEDYPATKVEKMIARECKQTGMSRDRILGYVDLIKESRLKLKFIKTAHNEAELTASLDIYFHFFDAAINPESKLANDLVETLKEYFGDIKEDNEVEKNKEAGKLIFVDFKAGKKL